MGRRQLARTKAADTMCADHFEWQELQLNEYQKPWPPRSGHCIATLPEYGPGQALIFGGYIEEKDKRRSATNDTWLFSVDHKWTEFVAEGSSDVPRARIAAQSVCVGSNVWLMGGWDPGTKGDGGEILNDVWRLDLHAKRWSKADLQCQDGAQLQPISRFQAAAVGNTIFIHTHRSLQDILALDVTHPDKPRLQLLPVAGKHGETPAARGLHSCTAFDGKLYLFGGASQQGKMMNDLWVLDLGTMQWTQLHPEGKDPHVRCSHTAAIVDSSIVFHGGSYYREDGKGLQPLDDVIVYSTEHNRWQEPKLTGSKPRARNAAVASMVAADTMLLHGGWNPFRETYDDSFLCKLA